MNRYKNIVGFAVVIILISAAIFIYTGSRKLAPFREFRSSEGFFTVLMPGTPYVLHEDMEMPFGKIDTTTYMAGSRVIGCAVAFADYPAKLIQTTDTQKLFDMAKNEAVKNAGGKLISENRIDYHKLPAMDVRIEVPGSAFTAVRYILNGPRFYTLMFFAPSEKGHEQDISKFFDSFQIDGVK